MKNTSRFLNAFAITLIMFFIVLIMAEPAVGKKGAFMGILLCGRIIIPSLFPFTVCVLFILKSGILKKLSPLDPFTKRVLGLSPEMLSVMLLSLIGGYPVGAKMLNEAVKMKKVSPERAGQMLNFCVNAGPAFIIAAVGDGIIGSRRVGYILFICHMTASVILCIISRFFSFNYEKAPDTAANTFLNPADNFVSSTAEAASSVLGICGFVILFSTVNSFVSLFYEKAALLKSASLLLEVTNGVTMTDNIYTIAFILGFSGVCVWFQILAVSGNIKINLIPFILFRILHGILSVVLTAAVFKILGISNPVMSNGKDFSFVMLYSTPALAVSMLMLGIVFLISVSGKKYNCKLLEDMV